MASKGRLTQKGLIDERLFWGGENAAMAKAEGA
jgi:hypothetical protein